MAVTNNEKLNELLHRSDTVEESAVGMLLAQVEEDYGILISESDKRRYQKRFAASKLWLAQEENVRSTEATKE